MAIVHAPKMLITLTLGSISWAQVWRRKRERNREREKERKREREKRNREREKE
jgi:hypothetical protein